MATKELFPASTAFAPQEIKGLTVGETKYWCRCGLSKNQPWCDGSHKGTGINPLAWNPEKDGSHYICICKLTKNPPFCDGTHEQAKIDVPARIGACKKMGKHKRDCKLCTGCGWTSDF